jgi:hypothetical protein
MKSTYLATGKSKLLYAAGLIFFSFFCNMSYGQNVCISDNGHVPDGSAMLDVWSNAAPFKGFLVPRLTKANGRIGIGSPATGLLYYETDVIPGFWYYNGAAWAQIGGSGWGFTGNSGLVSGTNNFLGTLDATPVYFVTGASGPNTRMTIAATGNIGIGTTTPDASSLLQLTSGSQGVLFPKVALTATNAAGPIASPANTLFVYNTATAGSAPNNVNPGFYYNAGNGASPNWVPLLDNTPPNAGWMVTGNYGTSPATPNFVGTLDANDLAFRANNSEIMRLSNANANVGIGTNAPNASAELSVNSTSKGLLIPNVALTATNAAGPITLPATSLLVYNTATAGSYPTNVTPGYYYNAGTGAAPNWIQFGTQGSSSFQYENRFRTSGTCGSSYYYFNSSNYGPGTYGDNTVPYYNSMQDGYYCPSTSAPSGPGTIPAFFAVWYVSYTATASTTFTGFNGWAIIEDDYGYTVNSTLLGGPPFSVTIYFYKYTNANGSTGNLVGTLCGSGSVSISTSFVPYAINFYCSTPVAMNAGDVLIGYCTISGCPYMHSTQYYSVIDVMGAMQF